MIATGFALIAGLLTLAPSARAQGTFPLQCRGGGQANMKYDSAERTIYARFRPAPGPAGNGLAPGQCSWLDRAFRAGEPWQICQRNITAINFFSGSFGLHVIRSRSRVGIQHASPKSRHHCECVQRRHLYAGGEVKESRVYWGQVPGSSQLTGGPFRASLVTPDPSIEAERRLPSNHRGCQRPVPYAFRTFMTRS